jgi:ATP adenylyltransferase
MHNRLWAPWRFSYIQEQEPKTCDCIFCDKPAQACDNDRDNLILQRGTHNFVILNRYPYNNAHMMVVPYTHTADIAELDEQTVQEMWHFVTRATRILKESCQAEGFNIGMNIGQTAGAGIDQHLHMHIVPRWNGDTNIMPVIGDTKVISQGLWDAYDYLRPYFTGGA